MLMIRLSRIGKKKQPTYRVTVAEKTKDTFGDALEILGSYDPRRKIVNLKEDRIKYWLSQGAQASGTVHNLLVEHKITEGPKVKVSSLRKKKEEKKESASASADTEAMADKKASTFVETTVDESADKEKEKPEKPEESKEANISAEGKSQPAPPVDQSGDSQSASSKEKTSTDRKVETIAKTDEQKDTGEDKKEEEISVKENK